MGVDVAAAVGEDRAGANAYDELGAGEVGEQRVVRVDDASPVRRRREPWEKTMKSMPTSGFSVTLPVLRNIPLPS